MKTFSFNHNDYVTVTLTKEGAEEFRDYLCDRGYEAILSRAKIHNSNIL